jgi:hypothetical protein
MARMKKYPLQREYVQVPNETAAAVEKKSEKPISLQALGLIVNMWSYNVEEWELRKSELYNRFAKNKEASVRSAWNDLMEAGYIIEFQFRNDKGHFDNVYYYRIKPFTEYEKEAIKKEVATEYPSVLENPVWTTVLENPVRKTQTGKSGPGNQVISNNTKKQNFKKKDLRNIINNKTTIDGKDPLDLLKNYLEK